MPSQTNDILYAPSGARLWWAHTLHVLTEPRNRTTDFHGFDRSDRDLLLREGLVRESDFDLVMKARWDRYRHAVRNNVYLRDSGAESAFDRAYEEAFQIWKDNEYSFMEAFWLMDAFQAEQRSPRSNGQVIWASIRPSRRRPAGSPPQFVDEPAHPAAARQAWRSAYILFKIRTFFLHDGMPWPHFREDLVPRHVFSEINRSYGRYR